MYTAYLVRTNSGNPVDLMQDASITRLRRRIMRNWGSKLKNGYDAEFPGDRRIIRIEYNPKDKTYIQFSDTKNGAREVHIIRANGNLGRKTAGWYPVRGY